MNDVPLQRCNSREIDLVHLMVRETAVTFTRLQAFDQILSILQLHAWPYMLH